MTFPPKAAFCWRFLNPHCSLIKEGKWWWRVTVGNADGERLDFLQALLFWPTPRTVVNKSGTWFPPSAAGLWQNIQGSWVVSTEITAQPLPRRNGTEKEFKEWQWEQGMWGGNFFPRAEESSRGMVGGADELINASKFWSLCGASQGGN